MNAFLLTACIVRAGRQQDGKSLHLGFPLSTISDILRLVQHRATSASIEFLL